MPVFEYKGLNEAGKSVNGLMEADSPKSLRAQLHSAQRMIDAVQDARSQLRLLDARLDEAVTRAIELSLRSATDADVSGLGSDVESLVQDMEALRAALETVDQPGTGGTGGATATA